MNSYAQEINLREGKREGSFPAKKKKNPINKCRKKINYHFKITIVIIIIQSKIIMDAKIIG